MNSDSCAKVEEATESKGATLLNWSDFLLQKLNSYGEPLNLRGAMPPLLPPMIADKAQWKFNFTVAILPLMWFKWLFNKVEI